MRIFNAITPSDRKTPPRLETKHTRSLMRTHPSLTHSHSDISTQEDVFGHGDVNQSIKGPHESARGQGRRHIRAPPQGYPRLPQRFQPWPPCSRRLYRHPPSLMQTHLSLTQPRSDASTQKDLFGNGDVLSVSNRFGAQLLLMCPVYLPDSTLAFPII